MNTTTRQIDLRLETRAKACAGTFTIAAVGTILIGLAWCLRAAGAEPVDGFDYPFGPPDGTPRCPGTAQCETGWQNVQDFRENNHLGEDWNFGFPDDDLGAPVYAVANGVVTYAQEVGGDGTWNGVILIRHSGSNLKVPGGATVSEVTSLYGHLDVSSINNWVSVGSEVRRGQQIGVIGPTPAGSTGPHLHFEIRTDSTISVGPGYSANTSGWVDPSDLIAANRPTKKMVVLIHGWIPQESGDLPPNYSRYQDKTDASELYNLYIILQTTILQRSDWKFKAYDWAKDAATGRTNPKQAAESAVARGQSLAELLHSQAPDLRYLHLIAHSAGAWMAREVARNLLQLNPYVVMQVTLLDPFIPDEAPGISSPNLTTASMNQLANVPGSDRIWRLDNYFADDFTDILGDSTGQRFAWGSVGLDLQVDWERTGDFSYEGFLGTSVDFRVAGSTPSHRIVFYRDHSGPIQFYADTISAVSMARPLAWTPLQLPPDLVPAGLDHAPYYSREIGWWRSLFVQSEASFPRVVGQPESRSAELGKPATIRVVAERATGYKWYRNGQFSGVTTPEINLLAIPANEGEYVVQVSNARGHIFSKKATFSIRTISSPPIIESVSPPSLVSRPLDQTQRITILGFGFTSTSGLEFSNSAELAIASNPARLHLINSGRIDYDIRVGDVEDTWQVRVINDSARSEPYTFYVTGGVDTTPPPAPIGLRATSSDWSRNSQVQVDWTNPTDSSGIAKVWVKVGSAPASSTDGVAYPLPANKPLLVNLPVTSGSRTVYVWLEDGAGNRNSDSEHRASLTLGADSVPPAIRILAPASNPLTTTQDSVVLSGDYSDDLSGVRSIAWGLASGSSGETSLSPEDGAWTTAPIGLQAGLNIIAVTATDGAGNVASTFWTVNRTTEAKSGSVTVTLSPEEAVLAGARWRVNGGDWRENGFTESNVPIGPRLVEFRGIVGAWRFPPAFVVNVTAGQNSSAQGEYVHLPQLEPPNSPNNPSPLNGAIDIRRVPRFLWTGGTPGGDLQYAFCIDPGNPTNPDPPVYQGFGSITGSAWQYPGTLSASTTYNWRVKAKANGLVTDGPLWRFTTEYSYADLAVKSLSLDGNVEPGATVTMNATVKNEGDFAAPVADVYFYLSRNPGGKEIWLNRSSFQTIGSLAPGEEKTISRNVALADLGTGSSFIDVWVASSQQEAEGSLENNVTSVPLYYIDGKNPEVTSLSLGSGYPFLKTGNSYPISYSAMDDIGVASIDFYYSLNEGESWDAIQEGFLPPAAQISGATYSWTIPADHSLTENLKIRMVARDDSGNWGERIAGPYEIRSGADPTVAVLAPNGGEAWDIGTTQQIIWEGNAPNGVDGVIIEVQHPAFGSFRFDGVPAVASGSYSWTVPVLQPSDAVKVRVILLDANFNDSEDFSDGFFAVRDASTVPAPWTVPSKITSVPAGDSGTKSHEDPSVTVDALGNVHLVYVYVRRTSSTIHQAIKYLKRTGGTWSAPATVYSVSQSLAGEYYLIDCPRIAADGDGNVHIVWQKDFAFSDWNKNEVHYSAKGGASWSAPFRVSASIPNASDGSSRSLYPALEVDADDRVHVAWAAVPGEGMNAYHRMRSTDGTWSPVSKVTTTGGVFNPSLAADDEGNVHLAAAVNNLSAEYAKWNGSEWSPSSVVMGSVQTPITIAAGSAGNVYMAWRFFDSDIKERIYYSHYDGSSWTERQRVPGSDSGNAKFPLVSVDSSNRPHFVWEMQNSSLLPSVFYQMVTPGGWSPAAKLNLTTQYLPSPRHGSFYGRSHAALSLSDGSMHVVWMSGQSGNLEVFENHANVGSAADLYPPAVSVSKPLSGQSLSIGSTVGIEWNASGETEISEVEISYTANALSANPGWTVISADEANTGSFTWTVPPDLSATVGQIRVAARDVAGNVGFGYSGTFTTGDLTPPVVTNVSPIDGAALTSGEAAIIQWNATDNVGVTSIDLEYSLNNGLSWAWLASASGNTASYEWHVPNTPTSTAFVRATAHDEAGLVASGRSDLLTITRANQPPLSPHSPFPLSGAAHVPKTAVGLHWSSTDLDGDSLSYEVRFGTSIEPPVVASGAGETSFVPTDLAYGTAYYWRIAASDAQSTTLGPLWSFTTEAAPPVPPQITGQPQNQTAIEAANVSFTVTASGTEPLIYQWRKDGVEIPGATAASYSVSNVQAEDAGIYSVIVRNVAGKATSANATLAVTLVNNASSGTDNTITINEDTTRTFDASDFGFADPNDGDGFMAVTITTLPSAGVIRAGSNPVSAGTSIRKFDIDSNHLTFEPDADGNGHPYTSFTFQVQDDGGTANGGIDVDPIPKTMTIIVAAVNDAPTFATGPDQTVLEDAGAQIVPNWATNISPGPSDESAQNLTFEVSNDNPGLFLAQPSISTAGTLTYTPAAHANGVATVEVKLKDSGGTENGGVDTSPAQMLKITISSENDPPTVTDVADHTANEDAPTAAIAFTVNDQETALDALTLAGHSSNSSLVPTANIAFDGNGAHRTVTITPAFNQSGTATITITVTDTEGGAAIDSFVLTVKPVNDAPTFVKGPDETVGEDADPQTVSTWATNISPGAGDESGQSLAFEASNDNAGLFSAQPAISPVGTLTYTPAANANGIATVEVRLKDDGGTADGGADTSPVQTFTITIASENDFPTVSNIGDQSTNEDTATAEIAYTVSDQETPPGMLTLAGSSSNTTLVPDENFDFEDSGSNRVMTITPAANQTGTATITVTVTDGDGGTASEGLVLTVIPVNDAPSFLAGGNQTATEDSGAQTAANWATDISPGPNDEAGQQSMFKVSSDNDALFSVQPAISPTGTLTYTPAADAHGIAAVRVELQDDGGTANGGVDTSPTQMFTISVTPENDPPVISSISDQTVDSGDSTGPLTFSVQDIETPSQNLTIVADSSNRDLVPLEDLVLDGTGSDRTITISPVSGESGITTITVTVTDTDDSIALTTFALTVLPRPTVEVTGKVSYYFGNRGVPGTWVNLLGANGAILATTVTASDGIYNLPATSGADYSIELNGSDEIPPRQGVTTLDVALIRRHILALSDLDSPYRILAADVNNSGSVTTLDIALIRQLILALRDDFTAGLWKFVRSDFEFGDPTIPWPFENSRIYPNLSGAAVDQDFVAIKLGDVNGSWTHPSAVATANAAVRANPTVKSLAAPMRIGSTFPTRPVVRIAIGRASRMGGGLVEIPIRARTVPALTTLQFTAEWDAGRYRYVGIGDTGLSGFDGENIGKAWAGAGKLPVSWDSPDGKGVSVPEGASLFSVLLEPLGDETAGMPIRISDEPTVREASVNFELAELRIENETQDGDDPIMSSPSILLSAEIVGAGVVLHVQTIEGRTIAVEMTEALDGPPWTVLRELQGDGAVQTLTDRNDARANRFYRARLKE